MIKRIEKAIRETLVINNPESIHIAIEKIIKVIDHYKPTHCEASGFTMKELNELEEYEKQD